MPKTFESTRRKTVSSIVKYNSNKQFGSGINRLEMGSSCNGINESLQMFCGKAMKNSSLPSQTSLLSSNGANSKSRSSSLIATKKPQSQKTTCNENSMWLFAKNEKSKKIDNNKSDYSKSISGMFTDGLSDSEDSTHEVSHFIALPKLGNHSLPSRGRVALSECSSDDRTKIENFAPALTKRETECVETNSTKNKLIKNEPGLMPSLTDHRPVVCKSAKTNQSEDETLKLFDLLNSTEKNSITEPEQVGNVRCASFHMYEPPNELLTLDSEHVGSELSNTSSVSLTPVDSDCKSSQGSITSFEQESQPYMELKDSSFKITQAMYLRCRKISSTNNKDKSRRKLSSRMYKSVIKEEQKSELENKSPAELSYTYSPNYEYKSFVGEEKHLGNFYLPKQPKMFENIDFSDAHKLRNAAVTSTQQHLKQHYLYDQNQNFIDTKVVKACNTSKENYQASRTVNIPRNSFPKIEHLSIDPFPGTSDRSSNISDFGISRCSATDSFPSISKNVQTFVKEWLDNQDGIEAPTGNEYLDNQDGIETHTGNEYLDIDEIPRKRRRHDINSEKWIEKTLSPEKMLSNYSCEYEEAYKMKAFHPIYN